MHQDQEDQEETKRKIAGCGKQIAVYHNNKKSQTRLGFFLFNRLCTQSNNDWTIKSATGIEVSLIL
jgi:hypothetical protein